MLLPGAPAGAAARLGRLRRGFSVVELPGGRGETAPGIAAQAPVGKAAVCKRQGLGEQITHFEAHEGQEDRQEPWELRPQWTRDV